MLSAKDLGYWPHFRRAGEFLDWNCATSIPANPRAVACHQDLHKRRRIFIRDSFNFLDSGGRENRRLTLESITRAVWNDDACLAQKLLNTTKLAREHIQVVDSKMTVRPLSPSCRVIVLDPPALEEAYRIEREYYHGNQILDAKAALPNASVTEAAKLKGKIAAARRQQTSFFGKKPFVNLVGLKLKRPDSIIEDIVATRPRFRTA